MFSREKNNIISSSGLQCVFTGCTGATARILCPSQLNTGMEAKNISITSANTNCVTVNGHRVKISGKVISGYIYFTTKQAVTAGVNIIKIDSPIASQIYVPIFNITDKAVLYGIIETTGYLMIGLELVAGKTYIFNIDYIIV